MNRKSITRYVKNALILSCLILFLAFLAVPMLWIFITSLMPMEDLYSPDIVWIPSYISLKGYLTAYELGFPRFFLNSLLVAFGATLITMSAAFPASYALARFAFRGSKGLSSFILSSQMIPPVLLILPYFIIFRTIGLYDTYFGLIFAHISLILPFAVWVMRGFIQGIPVDLEEAAMIDGCTRLRALRKIVIPISLPGVFSSSLLAFVMSWNDLVLALSLTSSTEMRTIPFGLAMLFAEWGFEWSDVGAACVIATLPIVFVFLYLQRFLIAGLTAGAVRR